MDRYLIEASWVSKEKRPPRPPGLTEREVIRSIARLMGLTEQTVRRRYIKTARKAAQREDEIARIRRMMGD